MPEAHREIVRGAYGWYGGVEVDTQGDACFVVFPRASRSVDEAPAVAAAVEHEAADSPGTD